MTTRYNKIKRSNITLFNSFKKRLLKKCSRLSNNSNNIQNNFTEAENSEIKLLESSNNKYDYSKFEKIQFIGRGSSGSVVRANLKDKVFALKSFNNTTIRKVNRELRLHKIVSNHKNILRSYGYTIIDTDPVYQINKYCLVLEYADSGTLNAYLNEHYDELNWKDKLDLASQLVNAVSCLHEQNIIHRDLHANNILIHRKTIKLSDFGLSTEETSTKETSNASHIFGIMPYIDPKRFIIENYKLNKKSDIYSIGVLLWQISSGRQPFCNVDYDIRLSLEITRGKREEIIKDTPVEYSKLYTDCWKFDPNERPDIQQVASLLDQLVENGFNNKSIAEISNTLHESIDAFYDSKSYLNSIDISIPPKVIYTKRRHANKIDSNHLTSPIRGKTSDKRGKDPNSVVKKICKGQEVACKYISNNEKEETERFSEFLMELSECKHIIRFHGISTIGDRNVMVFEWAERGTLRHLYEQKEIKWHYKVRIALNICRGLIFLQEANILHHDLRCQNILITESLEPKICNFELAHYSDGNRNSPSLSTDQATVIDVLLPWLAPEMLKNIFRYTTQCEIFSFGMLLWELTFEKIPYQGWEAEKIKKHVIDGGRESFMFGGSAPEIYQKKYRTMISNSWKQDPQERISFIRILDMLEELHNSIRYTFEDHSIDLLPDKTMNSNNLDDYDYNSDLELPDEDTNPVSDSIEKSFKYDEYDTIPELGSDVLLQTNIYEIGNNNVNIIKD